LSLVPILIVAAQVPLKIRLDRLSHLREIRTYDVG
jgi:hypothetical protein